LKKQGTRSSTDKAWWTKVFKVASFLSPNLQWQKDIWTNQHDIALVFVIAPSNWKKYVAAIYVHCEDISNELD